MDGSLSATFDQERSRARLGAIIVPLVALLVGLGVGYVVANRGDMRGPESADVGPTSTKDGVPVGYARTRAGAVTAVGQYVEVLAGPLLLSEDSFIRANSVLASRDYVDRATTDARKEVEAFASAFGPNATVHAKSLAFRVESVSRNSAVIAVWFVSIVQGHAGTAESFWDAGRYSLVWEGDWKLSRVEKLDVAVPKTSTGDVGENPLTPKDFEPYEAAIRS